MKIFIRKLRILTSFNLLIGLFIQSNPRLNSIFSILSFSSSLQLVSFTSKGGVISPILSKALRNLLIFLIEWFSSPTVIYFSSRTYLTSISIFSWEKGDFLSMKFPFRPSKNCEIACAFLKENSKFQI